MLKFFNQQWYTVPLISIDTETTGKTLFPRQAEMSIPLWNDRAASRPSEKTVRGSPK